MDGWSLRRSKQREGDGGSWWCLLVRGAPLASYGLVTHFPSCSPVVAVVAHVFEQRLTRLELVQSVFVPSGKMSVCFRRSTKEHSMRGRTCHRLPPSR